MFVVRIAQGQHRKRKIFEARKMLHTELVIERLHSIGWIAFAIGAGNQKCVALRGQGCGCIALHWQKSCYMAFGGKFLGELARQSFRGA